MNDAIDKSDKNIEGLRRRLFEAIDGVKDGSMPLEKAEVISNLAQVIVNSAKVDVDYQNKVKGLGTKFLEQGKAGEAGDDGVDDNKTPPNGITSVTRHYLRG